MRAEIEATPHLEILDEARDLPFDETGDLMVSPVATHGTLV
jgi:hypothetical protein